MRNPGPLGIGPTKTSATFDETKEAQKKVTHVAPVANDLHRIIHEQPQVAPHRESREGSHLGKIPVFSDDIHVTRCRSARPSTITTPLEFVGRIRR
jgi:hypothetical protein